jgi:hypothetical protein
VTGTTDLIFKWNIALLFCFEGARWLLSDYCTISLVLSLEMSWRIQVVSEGRSDTGSHWGNQMIPSPWLAPYSIAP